MSKNKLLEDVKASLFQKTAWVHALIQKNTKEHPDEEVPLNAQRGNFQIPLIDGRPTTNARKASYIINNGKYIKVKRNITYKQTMTFYDVMKLESVGDCRLHMESLRFGTSMQTHMGCTTDVAYKMINGHIAGFWRFYKHGKQFYVVFLGETYEEAQGLPGAAGCPET